MSSSSGRRRRSSSSSRRRSSSRPFGSEVRRASSIRVFKLADPILQSLLFIYLIYCLDTRVSMDYDKVLHALIGWQIVSCIANFVIGAVGQLKKERTICLIVILLYTAGSWIALRMIPEHVLTVTPDGDNDIPIYETISEVGSVIIAFWYYTICFREIKSLIANVSK